MSKTKHRHNREEFYGNDEEVVTKKVDRSKQKRIDRALRTKNIDELMGLDDEDDDVEYQDLLPGYQPYYHED
jgi:hypothetical protein